MKLTALDILTMAYGDSRNSVTPTILSRGLVAPHVAVELSTGTSSGNVPLWGVSVAVIRPDGTVRPASKDPGEPIRSGAFASLEQAEAHIAAMRSHLRVEALAAQERATSKSWKTKPLPAERARLKLKRSFRAAEWEELRIGFVPEAMEDKWFIYESRGWLSFHRSWTGVCVYRVRLRRTPAGAEIAETWVNRKTDEYSCVDGAYDAGLVSWMIDVLLLKRPARYPDTGLAEGPGLLRRWSDVGRAGLGNDA